MYSPLDYLHYDRRIASVDEAEQATAVALDHPDAIIIPLPSPTALG